MLFDEGLTLETSALGTLYGDQFTLSTQLMKKKLSRYSPPPTQYQSFFKNLSPLLSGNHYAFDHFSRGTEAFVKI